MSLLNSICAHSRHSDETVVELENADKVAPNTVATMEFGDLVVPRVGPTLANSHIIETSYFIGIQVRDCRDNSLNILNCFEKAVSWLLYSIFVINYLYLGLSDGNAFQSSSVPPCSHWNHSTPKRSPTAFSRTGFA